jgi:hypothetical protein
MVVNSGSEPIKDIRLKINGNWSMPQAREAVRQPPIPGAEVKDGQGFSGYRW